MYQEMTAKRHIAGWLDFQNLTFQVEVKSVMMQQPKASDNYKETFIFIDREAGEIIRLVASVCLSVRLSVCPSVSLSPLSRLSPTKQGR